MPKSVTPIKTSSVEPTPSGQQQISTRAINSKMKSTGTSFSLPNSARMEMQSLIKIARLSHSTLVILVLIVKLALAGQMEGASSVRHDANAKPPLRSGGLIKFTIRNSRQFESNQVDEEGNGFQLHESGANATGWQPAMMASTRLTEMGPTAAPPHDTNRAHNNSASRFDCPNGLLTFELSTGFIYKPSAADETLSMMPTLQLTDCLDYCRQNATCQAINFEMGLCVLLASSARHNQQNLFASQFPVFTIYAEKKCLLTEANQAKQRRRCQRAWTFERVAGYEMKIKPRRRLKLTTRELCMEACLLEREFACRSANWHQHSGECSLHDQDRHSMSQSEASDQQIKSSLVNFYGPHQASGAAALAELPSGQRPAAAGLLQLDRSRLMGQLDPTVKLMAEQGSQSQPFRQLFYRVRPQGQPQEQPPRTARMGPDEWPTLNMDSLPQQQQQQQQQNLQQEHPISQQVDYLENNCIYEPNKLCEFRKIQNKVLKTVDSIYQDVASLEECRQKCLAAPYRCYSFDYGDTSERVCRTSHLDQASLLSIGEPYLEVAGAITHELAACFNVSIQCRARGMVAQVAASKSFNGRIYAKSRPTTCMNDVSNSLKFELAMDYHDGNCDVRSSSNQQQGTFSNDIVIQHHDRIVTTQDVGLTVYCQYDLGNRSVTNNVDLAIERLPDGPMESKQQAGGGGVTSSSAGPMTITGLATTVVKSPNVTMRITNMKGQPVASATVGDRLALLFEIKEKSSPFGILVREIVAMDGRQPLKMLADGSHQPTNESPSNSIQFLDQNGCPTDANLMGPLVRMDPQGHRLLAPFDAFKFPSSEMVFFRAVVSSCVAECKPAACSGSPLAPASFGLAELAPPSYGDLFSPTPFEEATTRNLPISSSTVGEQNLEPTSIEPAQWNASTSTSSTVSSSSSSSGTPSSGDSATATTIALTTELPTGGRQTGSLSTAPPYESDRTTKMHNQTPSTQTLDQLTTRPEDSSSSGASSSGSQQPPATLASSMAEVDHKQTMSNDSNTQQDINMTNNHNLGRPSPRPMTSSRPNADANQTNSSGAGAESNQPPIKLDPLTAQERQAILDLLSGGGLDKSYQQSGGSTSQSGAALLDGQHATSGLMKLYPILDSFKQGTTSARLRGLPSTSNSAASPQSVLLEIKALLSDQFNERRLNKLISEDQTESSGQSKNKRSYASYLEPFGSAPPSEEFIELMNRTLIDYILAEELKTMLLTQMLVDEAKVSIMSQASSDVSGHSNELADRDKSWKEARNLADPDDKSRWQSREFPMELLDDFFNTLDWPALDRPAGIGGHPAGYSFEQANQLVKARFDHELARKIEFILKVLNVNKAPSESHQLNQQRDQKRSRRDIAGESEPSSGYVLLSEPQADGNQDGLRFTGGHVEMYHMDQLGRIKRHASSNEEFEAHSVSDNKPSHEEPKYELEEMVVQSIKIVDRLYFEDEQSREQQLNGRGGGKSEQSNRGTLRKLARERDSAPKDNRQLRSGDAISGQALDGDLRQPMKTQLSATGILLVALCFIFVQISMVLLSLIYWSNQRRQSRPPSQNNQRSLSTQLPLDPAFSPVVASYSSTISSSSGTFPDCSIFR